MQHSFRQGLAGDGPRVDARAAQHGFLPDNRYALAPFRRPNRRALPSGSSTDHPEVIVETRHWFVLRFGKSYSHHKCAPRAARHGCSLGGLRQRGAALSKDERRPARFAQGHPKLKQGRELGRYFMILFITHRDAGLGLRWHRQQSVSGRLRLSAQTTALTQTAADRQSRSALRCASPRDLLPTRPTTHETYYPRQIPHPRRYLQRIAGAGRQCVFRQIAHVQAT